MSQFALSLGSALLLMRERKTASGSNNKRWTRLFRSSNQENTAQRSTSLTKTIYLSEIVLILKRYFYCTCPKIRCYLKAWCMKAICRLFVGCYNFICKTIGVGVISINPSFYTNMRYVSMFRSPARFPLQVSMVGQSTGSTAKCGRIRVRASFGSSVVSLGHPKV